MHITMETTQLWACRHAITGLIDNPDI